MRARIFLLLAAALASACTTGQSGSEPFREAARITIDDAVNPGEGDVLFLGAGDIARCSQIGNAMATGDLIRALLGKYSQAKVFTAGDNAYESGTASQFRDCYDPAWGSFNDRTAPSPGNHEYRTAGARPYFDYFDYYRLDPAAKARGYYSFDWNEWHIVSLNSNIPMDASSPQVVWLDGDLRNARKRCILAFWHHPLFSNGDQHGANPGDLGRHTQELWRKLEHYRADVIVNGHDHDYERFAPQDHGGTPSPGGIRQFVAGTGGAEIRGFLSPPVAANSEHQELRHGVLVLTLGKSSYKWAFLGTGGKAYDRSSGVTGCHKKPWQEDGGSQRVSGKASQTGGGGVDGGSPKRFGKTVPPRRRPTGRLYIGGQRPW